MSTPTLLDLKVPSVGESVTEMEVGEWLKPEGATVARDENLVVLETDKATMEVPAPAAGRLVKIHKRKGERVRVGDLLGQIDPAAPESTATPEATRPESAQPPAAASVPKSTAARVMPAAARVLAEKKLAPDQVSPTGPGGRVLKEDVERAAGAAATTTQPAEPPPASPAAEPSPGPRGEERVPMSLMRRKIAERLVQAQQDRKSVV